MFLVSFLEAKQFYISFQFVSNNYFLTYKNFYCSKIVNISQNNSQKLLFYFSLQGNSQNSYSFIKKFCKKNSNLIIDRLLKERLILKSFDKYNSNFLVTKTKLTYLPHKFDIIIKNSKIYFYLIGD